MKRQQDLIRAIIAEAKKPNNIGRLGQIADIGLKQFETGLDRKQILALATIYKNVQPGSIQTKTLIGKDGRIGSASAILLDAKKNKYLVDWLLKGDETAANRLTSVAVKNGTRVAGAARSVATMLRTEGGFEADSAPGAPDTRQEAEAAATRILYVGAAQEPHARQIAHLLGGGQLVKDTAPDTTGVLSKPLQRPDITVVLGKDLAETFARQSARQ